jgi:general secretion pathway protein N
MISLYPLFHTRRVIVAGLVASTGLIGAASLAWNSSKQARIQPQTSQPSAKPPVPDRVAGGNSPNSTKLPVSGLQLQGAIGRNNPLWGIPLASLTATRELPIFSPTRSRPQVASPLPVGGSSRVPPSRPPLALVGAIAGQHEGFAIFFDETTKRIIRLKTGESHGGWTLRSVQGREVTLQKDHETAVVALPPLPLMQ